MKRSIIILTIFVLIMSAVITVPAYAEPAAAEPVTYYVSITGNDQNPGTVDKTFRTIQHAADVANIGDKVIVQPGNYLESVNARREGVYFLGINYPVIRRFAGAAQNVTIQGFYSLRNPSNGGAFESLANGVRILDNIADAPCTAGVILRANNGRAERNEIFGSRQCPEVTSGPDADGIRAFGDGHYIGYNYIHDIVVNSTTNPTAHSDCVQNWGRLTNTIIEGNRCIGINAAGVQTDGGSSDNVQNITIRNNVFVAARCLNMFGDRISFTNNVCIGFGPTSYLLLRNSDDGSRKTTNATIKNNVFFNTSGAIIVQPGMVIDGGGNVIYNAPGFNPAVPRRDSGYSYKNGVLAWPTDKWGTTDPKLNQDYQTTNLTVCYAGLGCPGAVPTVTPTTNPIPTVTRTPTVAPTVTRTATTSRTPTQTVIPASKTPTASKTATFTPSTTYTATRTPTRTPSRTHTATWTPTLTASATNTPTPTFTQGIESGTPTNTMTLTPVPPIIVPTITRTATPVITATPTSTPPADSCDDIKVTSWASFVRWLRCRLGR